MKKAPRRWWTLLVTLGALVVVFAALASALFQLAVLAMPGYQQKIADYVTAAAGHPIDIGGVQLGWRRFGPSLELTDIALYPDALPDGDADLNSAAMSIDEVALGFSLWRLIRTDWMPARVELSGLRLDAVIDAEGRLQLRGIDSNGGPTMLREDYLRLLDRFSHVGIEDCSVLLSDTRVEGLDLEFAVRRADLERTRGGVELTLALTPPNGGEAELQLEASLDGDPARPLEMDGRWHASLEGYDGAPWLGPGAPQGLELGFANGALSADGVIQDARLGATDVTLSASAMAGRWEGREAHSDGLAATLHIVPEAQGLRATVEGLRLGEARGPWPDDAGGELRAVREGGQWRFDGGLSFVRLDDVMPWVALFGQRLPAHIGAVGGDLRTLSMRFASTGAGPHYDLSAQVDGLSLAAGSDDENAFSGVSGALAATDRGGSLTIDPERAMTVHLPKWFSQDLAIDRLEGVAEWTFGSDGVEIALPDFKAESAQASGSGTLALLITPEMQARRIQLDTRFSANDALALKPYIPLIWTQGLGPFLRRAVEAGRVASGSLSIDGPLLGMPYAEGEGRFDLMLDVDGGQLSFHPDWPSIQAASARIELHNGRLVVDGRSGRIGGGTVTHAKARIDDIREARLVVETEVSGDAAGFYRFLVDTPLRERLSALLTRTTLKGPAQVQVELQQNLRERDMPEVQGLIRLQDNEMLVSGLPDPVTAINGEVRFDGVGQIRSEHLAGVLDGMALDGAIVAADGLSGALQLSGPFTPNVAGEGLSRYLPAFVRQHLSGTSSVAARLPLGGTEVALELRSDLTGLRSDLPAPYTKAAGDALPVRASIGERDDDPLAVALAVGDDLQGDLRFDAHGVLQRGRIRLGGANIDALPDEGLRVDGSVGAVEPLDWIGVFTDAAEVAPVPPADQASLADDPAASDAPADASPDAETSAADENPVRSVDLDIASAGLAGFRLAPITVSVIPYAGGVEVAVGGEGALGTLSWARDDNHLIARLERVAVVDGSLAEADTDADGAPGSSDESPGRDPGTWPSLDIDAAQVRLKEAQIGRVQVATEHIEHGQRLVSAHAAGAELELEADGRWTRLNGQSEASLSFFSTSSAIDRLLGGLGYLRTLKAKTAALTGDLRWSGGATGLIWRDVDGYVDLAADRGSVIPVEPGAGRVLGLMNFYALPRRLMLDFRDVTDTGLGFDQIDGRFDIQHGLAHTDNLDIKGPSVSVEVRGNVDLLNRTYDQRVAIYPNVSSGVTLGALLLGGPAAGLVALLAQQVLDHPLGSVTQLSYHLTGPWDNPQIERSGDTQ